MKRNNLTADKLYLFQPISELAGFSYLIMCYAMKLIFIQTWVDVVRSDVILGAHRSVSRRGGFLSYFGWA